MFDNDIGLLMLMKQGMKCAKCKKEVINPGYLYKRSKSFDIICEKCYDESNEINENTYNKLTSSPSFESGKQ